MAQQGYGLWYDDVLDSVPDNFDPMLGLKVIGYNTTRSNYAIEAFKIHYIQTDTSNELTDFDKQVIYNLYRKML